ncbi:MAG: AAA family ATPase [bacterium]
MKIKSLKLTDHPILGNLELDFTIGDRVADNVIFAGENGSGKTTVLNLINDFFKALGESSSKITDKGSVSLLSTLLTGKTIPSSYSIEIGLCDLYKNNQTHPLLNTDQMRAANDSSLSEDERNRRMALEACTIALKDGQILFNKQVLNSQNLRDWQIEIILTSLKTFFIKSDFDIKTRAVDSLPSASKKNLYSNSSDAQDIKELFITLAIQDAIKLRNRLKQEADKNITLEAFYENNPPILDIFMEAFAEMNLNKEFKEVRESYSSWDVIFTSKNLKDSEILLENLSSGEKQIVFKGVYFLREFYKYRDIDKQTNSTFACFIDEPEISMHPRWQKTILNFYKGLVNADKKQISQIFMATHSPFIIHEANPQTDKVIVLRKDDTGKIAVVQNPSFASCGSEILIQAAFDIDNFKKTSKPLVITEGKTDRKILEIAWQKLYSGEEVPFEIHDAGSHPDHSKREGGVKWINEHLRYLSNVLPERKVLGIFDNDIEGNNQFNGLETKGDGWKQDVCKITDKETFIYKEHPKNAFYAILLPIPHFRDHYECEDSRSDYLSIEHYFSDEILGNNSLIGKSGPKISNIFTIAGKNGNKNKFAESINEVLDQKDFEAFKTLFDAIKYLINKADS